MSKWAYYAWKIHYRHDSVMSVMTFSIVVCPLWHNDIHESLQTWLIHVCNDMSHIQQWYHVWMCHATYEKVISQMNQACHIWKRNVIHEWGMPRTAPTTSCSSLNESCHVQMSHATSNESCLTQPPPHPPHLNESCYVWMSRVNHVTIHTAPTHPAYLNESCRIWMSHVTYKWVMPHLKSHVTHSPHPILPIWISHAAYEWVVLHMNKSCYIWMSRVNHVTHESFMSHSPHPILLIWMSHVAYEWVMSPTNGSCHIWRVMSHTAPTPSSASPAADAALLNRGGGGGWGESWNLPNFPRISANNFRVLPQPKIWPPPQSEMEVLIYAYVCAYIRIWIYVCRCIYICKKFNIHIYAYT